MHFAAGKEQVAKRLTQWERAIKLVAQRRADDGVPVAIIGDVNSTGFFDHRGGGERTLIQRKLDAAGMRLLTDEVPCSEYDRPEGQNHLEASALDHVAATEDFPIARRATVRGYCAAVNCRPRLREAPADFSMVSDHCPVVVGAQ